LDIDIDDELEAYKLGCAFVDANNIKYSLTSKDITELGGAEIARLPDLFEADYDWSKKGKAQFRAPVQRVVIQLFEKESPLACENFKGFIAGDKKSKECGKMLSYRGVPFHRIIKGFMMQGGDFVTGTGAGGESMKGKSFKDDPAGLKLKISERGVVAMSNSGKNSNTCQFFISFRPMKELDGKHVVFGKVVEGIEVIDRVEAECAAGADPGKPLKPVKIVECGPVVDS